MTTIRKIVTSKIDGDDANNTSTSEIRPFGEMAAYINTDTNGPDKLELLMFDGVRTHLRSKVLSKGTFYGGDADSGSQGDGIENFDTIKLIPDAELHYNDSSYGNDQYIVIDPTFPNHIHVRAGGAIDASNALLILGGELNNVSVSDAADQVEIRTNDTHTWLFGSDGSLTVPDAGIKGGPGGVNKVDLSWELILTSGKTIKINPGSSGVVSPTFFGFNSDASGGGMALPAGSSIDDRLTGVIITGAGLLEVNRFYPKVSNTLYEAVDAGVTYRLINQSGTWSLDVVGANNPQYTSADLITWANAGGGLPVPTGEFSTRETTLTVNTNTWTFGANGNLTLPQTNMNSSPAPVSLPGITWTDGTFQSGRTINIPQDQSMKLEFTSSQYGSGNLQIRDNGIKTSAETIILETGNSGHFNLNAFYKEITFSESYGSIVFGTETRNQTGHFNDIEIKSYGDGTNGNVYISAGGSPTNNRWTFKPNGTLVVPGAVQNTNYFEIKAGTVSDNTWNLGVDGSTVFPNNTLKGYCFTATNIVTNYIPQSSQFMYSDSPILGQILSIGGTWYIKGPGLVGWKQITAVQDNSGVALIVRIGSGNTPLGDGSEFPSGGGNVYTISQYLDLDLQVADKTWTFDQAGNLTLPQGSTLKGAGSLTVSTNYQPQLGPYTGIVSQSMTGNGYMVVGNNLSDIFAGVNLNSLIGSTLVIAGQTNTVLGVTYLGFGNSREEYSVQISGPSVNLTGGSGVAISITKAETKNDWIFGTDGNLILPANGDIVSSTGVGQLANRVSGTWTVTTGTNNYSFTVPINGAYQLWVRGNIPNGILSYIATVHVTNFNVPVLGTQRAWNYTGGGTPISLISMPAQIIGAEGTISTTTASGTTNNVFVFGISNTSASTQTVSWGYTRISQ